MPSMACEQLLAKSRALWDAGHVLHRSPPSSRPDHLTRRDVCWTGDPLRMAVALGQVSGWFIGIPLLEYCNI